VISYVDAPPATSPTHTRSVVHFLYPSFSSTHRNTQHRDTYDVAGRGASSSFFFVLFSIFSRRIFKFILFIYFIAVVKEGGGGGCWWM
jgi:hypothetical protein